MNPCQGTKIDESATSGSPPNIFHYTDYRQFLQDWLTQAKQRFGFSYSSFSRRSGFRSRSFFKMVLDGHRELKDGSLQKFMSGLGLSFLEQEYFRNLVLHNQAKTREEKELFFYRLSNLQVSQSNGPKDGSVNGRRRLIIPFSSRSKAEVKILLDRFYEELAALAAAPEGAEETLILSAEIIPRACG